MRHRFGAWQTIRPATCVQEGLQQRTCKRCDAMETRTLKMLAHWAGKWQVAVQPTAYKPGVQHKLCKRCGQVLEQRALRYPLAHFAVPTGPADLTLQRFLPDLDARELFVVQVSLVPDSVTGIPLSPDGYYIGTLQFSLPSGQSAGGGAVARRQHHLIDLRARCLQDGRTLPRPHQTADQIDGQAQSVPSAQCQDQRCWCSRRGWSLTSRQADNQRLTPAQVAALCEAFIPPAPPALANMDAHGQ